MIDPSRLYQQLQNTGIAIKDQPMYQFLRELIRTVASLNTAVGGTGSVINNVITINETQQIIADLSSGGGDGDGDSLTIPGPAGEDGANGMVPYFIDTNEVFTVPLYKQALFSMNIDNQGTLDVEGFLIEVD